MRRAILIIGVVMAASAQLSQVVIERVVTGLHFLNAPSWTPEDTLLFADVPTDRILRFTPGKSAPVEIESRAGGVAAITFDSKGNMYVAEPRARRITRSDRKGKMDVVAERFEGKRLNAPNDLVVRSDGNLYFTDPAFGSQQDAAELGFYGIFRIDPKGALTAIARWTTRPNGIALSPNGRLLYVADSDAATVHVLDLDRDGAAAKDRVHIANLQGAPGGLRTDVDGNLYVASREVFVFNPAGMPLRTIDLPEAPSNMTFGDVDLKSLYVTARTSVYRVQLGIKGFVPYLP
jgi:sugar lactone lactonase YvrE